MYYRLDLFFFAATTQASCWLLLAVYLFLQLWLNGYFCRRIKYKFLYLFSGPDWEFIGKKVNINLFKLFIILFYYFVNEVFIGSKADVISFRFI